MPEYIDANSIELDPEEESNIFEAGSFELDEEEPTAPKAKPQESIADKAIGVGEAAASAITGLASWIPGGIVKAAGLVSGQLEEGSALGEEVQRALTYEPKTEAGQRYAGHVSAPFEWLSEKAQEAGDVVYDKTGSALLGTAARTAIEAVPFIAPALAGKGLRGAKALGRMKESLAYDKPIDTPTVPVRPTEGIRESVETAMPERPVEKVAEVPAEPLKEAAKPEAKVVPAESVKLDEVVSPEKPVSASAEKQPWEMTKKEFQRNDIRADWDELSPEIQVKAKERILKDTGGDTEFPVSEFTYNKNTGDILGENYWKDHKHQVKDALSEGKPVPPEVLKDYPELAKDMTPTGELPGTTLSFMGMQGLYEGAVKTMQDISATTAQIIENTKVKPEIRQGVQSAKNAMIEHDRNIRSAEFTSKQLEKIVKDVVPKADRQMLMIHAYEQKMTGKAWDQLNDIEKGVVKWAAKEKNKLNDYIKENDILDMMESEDVNHIFHHWIDPKTGEPFAPVYGKFSKGLPQAKQRTIPTYEEGIKQGLTPATTNIGKLIGLEWEAATRANNARQLVKTLHGVKGDPEMSITLRRGAEPKPIRMVERWDLLQKQGLSEDYVRYESPFLDKAITFKTSDGTLKQIQGAVGVQKELYPFVKAYVENPNYGNLSQLNFASKSMKLGVSMFHVVSLGMQELANLRTPFVHIPKGLKLAKELGPTVKLLHQEGLEMFKGYEDLGYQNKFFKGDTELGRMGNAVTAPIGKIRDFIFNVVQPGMKISFADMQLRKLLPEYLKQAGEKITAEEVLARVEKGLPVPDAALKCAREVVQKSDGHFSGEHYKRSLLETNRFMAKLYFSPEARKWWQTALLSPTWQREHLLVAKNVAKSVMPDSMIKKLGLQEMGPIKSQYRKYALGGTMIVGAVDMWNQMATYEMDGESKHIWENPQGKGFAVRAWWNEPDYQITDKNGKKRTIKGGPAYIRPLKSLFEVAEWSHDPFRKVSYKLSPMVTAIGEQIWGQRGYGAIESLPKRAWDFITDVSTPIVFDQAISVAQGKRAPEGAVTSFFGMPSSKGKFDKGKIPPKPPY